MKNTVAIVFSGGCYGTYLEWCLTTLSNDVDLINPFTNVGNSHIFRGNHLLNMSGWRQYVASGHCHQFVRLHPKIKSTDSIQNNVFEIADQTHRVIYIIPDQERTLLIVNNFFHKIWGSWIEHMFANEIAIEKIYSNWPVPKNTPLDQISTWVMREFLSYYLMPAWTDQTKWDCKPHQQPANLIAVTVSELLFNFENTLQRLKEFCELDYQKPIANLYPFHEKNLQLQKHIDHDQICRNIVNSIKEQTNLKWSPLTLPSEAWVQWELRNQGFEIRCNGLDKFPTNSVQLRELLYQI